MQLPDLKTLSWWHRDASKTLIAGVPPLVAGLAGALKATWLDDSALGLLILSWVGWAWLLAATIHAYSVARRRDRDAEENKSPRDLWGCLRMLHSAILFSKGLHENEEARSKLRMTIHKVRGESLLQIVPYAGGSGGAVGRTFSARSGVVGRVFTSGELVVVHRPADQPLEQYLKVLRRDWHMPEAEVRELAHDRYSWMALPLLRQGVVAGVIFADSAIPDFFDPVTQELMIEGQRAIVEYAKDRYGS